MPRLTPLKADLASIAEDYRQGRSGRSSGLNTGFRRLDDTLNGLHPGLLSLGGVPSTGKTSFALQLGDQLIKYNDKTLVLFYTYEQSRYDLVPFILARRGRVKIDDITRPPQANIARPRADAWDKIRTSLDDSSESLDAKLFFVEADERHAWDQIQDDIVQLQSQYPNHSVVVIVDYLQLMPLRLSERVFSEVEKLDKICHRLASLARRYTIPVIALSAITRSSYGKVKQDAFKGSGAIEYASSVAAILHDCGEPQGDERELQLTILKNRHGKRFVEIGFSFDPSRATFREIPAGA